MGIDRKDYPTVGKPVEGESNWAKVLTLIDAQYKTLNNPLSVNGSVVVKNAVFQIGGCIYVASEDVAISGLASDYVKISPNTADSGATCSAVFVASLSGVVYNTARNGFYDVDGNLYIFDGEKAYDVGETSEAVCSPARSMSQFLNQSVRTDAYPSFASFRTTRKGLYVHDTAPTSGGAYTALSPAAPIVGDKALVSGSIGFHFYDSETIGLSYIKNGSYLTHISATTLRLYGTYMEIQYTAPLGNQLGPITQGAFTEDFVSGSSTGLGTSAMLYAVGIGD